jgi:hypothetical protein
MSVFVVGAEVATAQVEFTSDAATINLKGRVHIQFNHTSADAAELPTTFFVRRARLTAEITVNDFVYGKLQPEYGEGIVGLRDAYVRLSFSRAFRTTAGQFKRPFDVFELVSSTQILVIERAGGVREAADCAGIGSVCTLSRFTEKLLYADRDIGFMIDGRLSHWRYSGAITNGRGPNNTIDENGSKSFAGRLEYNFAGGNGRVGVHAAAHDYVFTNPADSTTSDAYGYAYGADVDWGEYETPGVHVKVGVVYGDNWRNQVGGATADASKFLTAQAIVSYMFPIADSRFVYGIEPMGRVSWGDPDRAVGGDEGLLLTPGAVLFFSGRNKFAINIDYYQSKGLSAEYSVKAQMYLYF